MNLEDSIKIAIKDCGVQLYDIVKVKENDLNIFRVYITSKDGINLEKCAEVSNIISPLLDVYEPMSGNYNLEVSSPGIERKLKTLEHFMASVGEKIKIKEYSTQTIKGELIEVLNDGTIKIKEDDGYIYKLNYDDILSASTYFEWNR